jgi:hypothetical protein
VLLGNCDAVENELEIMFRESDHNQNSCECRLNKTPVMLDRSVPVAKPEPMISYNWRGGWVLGAEV